MTHAAQPNNVTLSAAYVDEAAVEIGAYRAAAWCAANSIKHGDVQSAQAILRKLIEKYDPEGAAINWPPAIEQDLAA